MPTPQTKRDRAAKVIQHKTERLSLDVFYIWLGHKHFRVNEVVKVYAPDSYSAHLYAQHYWGEDFTVQLLGEPEGEEVTDDPA